MQVIRCMVGSKFNSLDHVKRAVFNVCEFVGVRDGRFDLNPYVSFLVLSVLVF